MLIWETYLFPSSSFPSQLLKYRIHWAYQICKPYYLNQRVNKMSHSALAVLCLSSMFTWECVSQFIMFSANMILFSKSITSCRILCQSSSFNSLQLLQRFQIKATLNCKHAKIKIFKTYTLLNTNEITGQPPWWRFPLFQRSEYLQYDIVH